MTSGILLPHFLRMDKLVFLDPLLSSRRGKSRHGILSRCCVSPLIKWFAPFPRLTTGSPAAGTATVKSMEPFLWTHGSSPRRGS